MGQTPTSASSAASVNVEVNCDYQENYSETNPEMLTEIPAFGFQSYNLATATKMPIDLNYL